MALTTKPYTGTRDFFPKDKRVQNHIFQTMRATAESFGYEPYDGPLLEEVELYKAKSGEELINDQIYSFTDRGERFVAIRPEMTPTLARMVAQICRTETKPIRWYAIPNLMRYERPQKGRLREHWQFNCDIFGAPGRMGEVEILQVAIDLMKRFGATETMFEIRLNDREIIDAVFKNLMKLDDAKTYKLYKIVDRSKKVPMDAVEKMVDELGLEANARSIFMSYLGLQSFESLFAFLNQHEIQSAFADFHKALVELKLDRFVHYDPAIVRGLDYYTGIVFEIFDTHPENRRAICGGGAYGNLLKIFGEDSLPGVGFGLGDVTLTDFLKTHALLPDLSKPMVDLYLSTQVEKGLSPIMTLASELRLKGVNVVAHLEPVKVKKLFPYAEKVGARFVGILDERELSENVIQVKNMQTRDQQNMSLNDADAILNTVRPL